MVNVVLGQAGLCTKWKCSPAATALVAGCQGRLSPVAMPHPLRTGDLSCHWVLANMAIHDNWIWDAPPFSETDGNLVGLKHVFIFEVGRIIKLLQTYRFARPLGLTDCLKCLFLIPNSSCWVVNKAEFVNFPS